MSNIDVCDECEFTIIITNLILTLSKLDNFKLLIWDVGRDLPHKYSDDCDFMFLQEGMRVRTDKTIEYIYYDTIEHIEVII